MAQIVEKDIWQSLALHVITTDMIVPDNACMMIFLVWTHSMEKISILFFVSKGLDLKSLCRMSLHKICCFIKTYKVIKGRLLPVLKQGFCSHWSCLHTEFLHMHFVIIFMRIEMACQCLMRWFVRCYKNEYLWIPSTSNFSKVLHLHEILHGVKGMFES